ncbi:hypothetical protein AYI69_g2598 [Smittium culicis]|uniref:Chorion class high-cysteine HCB protein 13 n=1 Tax=Smittium culicis TaxID=133412 RepID=A0A1R1YM40_9FUNG|nr:hypothetical protein AYI69_g7621 [Smittium culicis]OMJ27933.1 hypothetical protein AYI69_g2598 [Smittium culicis]
MKISSIIKSLTFATTFLISSSMGFQGNQGDNVNNMFGMENDNDLLSNGPHIGALGISDQPEINCCCGGCRGGCRGGGYLTGGCPGGGYLTGGSIGGGCCAGGCGCCDNDDIQAKI